MWNPFANQTTTTERAAADLHGKGSKLQTAHDAILVDDLRRMAADERAAVTRYRDKTVFGGAKNPADPENGELIVADDVQINQGPTWKTIASVLGPVALAILGYKWLDAPPAPPAPVPATVPAPVAAATPADADTRYRITPLEGD